MARQFSQRPYQRKGEPWIPPAWYTVQAPRWRLVLDDLAARGGVCSLRLKDWAPELGIPEQSLVRVVKRLEEYGLVAIVREWSVGTQYGGRRPNRYELVVPWDQWERHKDTIAYRVQQDRVRGYKQAYRDRNRTREKVERKQETERRAIALAAARIERAFALADVALGYRPEVVVDDDEVAGWS